MGRADTLVRFFTFVKGTKTPKINPKVKGGGQECPPYITGSCPHVG